MRFAVAGLQVAAYRRRNRLEQRPVGFQIDDWRTVEAIQAAHEKARAFHGFELDDRGADRVRPNRRAQ
ncbi:hypothetical protein D3C71_2168910 [compost metagenome]